MLGREYYVATNHFPRFSRFLLYYWYEKTLVHGDGGGARRVGMAVLSDSLPLGLRGLPLVTSVANVCRSRLVLPRQNGAPDP